MGRGLRGINLLQALSDKKKAAQEAEAQERARAELEAKEQLEKERIEKERLEKERLDKERQAKEELEKKLLSSPMMKRVINHMFKFIIVVIKSNFELILMTRVWAGVACLLHSSAKVQQ